MICGVLWFGLLAGACLSGLRRGSMTTKPNDWVPEVREVPTELTPEYGHADYVPTVLSQMNTYSLMGRLQVASKELWLTIAKETR